MKTLQLIALAVLVGSASGKPASAADAPAGVAVEARIAGDVVDREPIGAAVRFNSDIGRVFCWSRVTGCPDTCLITHVWLHEGTERASVELPVRSPVWRTWSSKEIRRDWIGGWEVRILAADGQILESLSFEIVIDSTTVRP